jgi:competence protein ComEC
MGCFRIAFLDVGHGDFSYAETPLGDNLIIDLGSGDVVPSRYLSKVTDVSELQISHPHTDHFDDITAVSGKAIKSFRCPNPDRFTDQSIGWKNGDKVKIAKLRELKRTVAADNKAVRVGSGFDHTVWFPPAVDYSNPNTASIVTTLSYGGITVLLGGDLPSSGWEGLLKNPNFVSAISRTTIFKVPHHGRKEGCCDELFEKISPMLCIISDKSLCRDNKNTAATDWYSKRASGCNVVGCQEKRKVLSTRCDGSIFVEVNDQRNWWVHTNTGWKTD